MAEKHPPTPLEKLGSEFTRIGETKVPAKIPGNV